MIKVFLSHSSVQKQKVESIASKLGFDYSIIDKYCFEDGNQLTAEIDSAIDGSSVFALMISPEALASDWVIYEIARVRDLVDEEKIIFCPFFIEEDVTIEQIKNTRGLKWITKYLINCNTSANLIARKLRGKIRESMWELSQKQKMRDSLFVGRNEEMKFLEEQLFESLDCNKKAIIVSGLPHVGRKKLLQVAYVTKIDNNLHPSYAPIDISLQEDNTIDDFAQILNDALQVYKHNDLLEKLADGTSRKEIVILLIKKLLEYKEVVIIEDDRCIVRGNGSLADWFKDVISHPDFPNKILLLIASKYSLSAKEGRNFRQILSMSIHPLKKAGTTSLFNAYSQIKEVECSRNVAKGFIDDMSGYPDQVFGIVDEIAKHGLQSAINHKNNLLRIYEKDIAAIIEQIKQTPLALQLLVFLSKFEFIGFEFLSNIFIEDSVNPILEQFDSLSVIEVMGASRNYIRLNNLLADYVDRRNFVLDKKYEERLRELTLEMVRNSDSDDYDLSENMYIIKEKILRSPETVDEKYLLPSFALKAIREEYKKGREGNYRNVIVIADRVLNDFRRNNYESMQYTIRYWLCEALCKLQDERLFEEVKKISNEYSKNFLRGYYYRIKKDYSSAEHYLKKAVSANPDNKKSYTSKAEHELTIVYMKRGNYSDALVLAEKSYRSFPTNPYHIEAYYHCVVRVGRPDVQLLKELREAMDNSYDSNKEQILGVFDAEYLYYYEHKYMEAIEILSRLIKENKKQTISSAIVAFREICEQREMKHVYKSIVAENLGSL